MSAETGQTLHLKEHIYEGSDIFIGFITYPIKPELFRNSDVEQSLEETFEVVLYCKKNNCLTFEVKAHLMSTSCCIFSKVYKDSQSIFLAEAGNSTGHDNAALLMGRGFAKLGTFDSF